ncbi:hypothetical protein BH20ACI1_BH20ACI1_08080 [soil metagenome]
MPDKEIQAIEKCTEFLNELDDNEAKIRVIQYLVNRFKLNSTNATIDNQDSIPESHQISAPNISHENGNIINVEEDSDFPSLDDVVIKDLPKNEPEWVLVYCFYASNFGRERFTRNNIKDCYKKSKRDSDSTRKNLTQNINSAVKKDWIKSLPNDDYIMKDEGVEQAKSILLEKGNSE